MLPPLLLISPISPPAKEVNVTEQSTAPVLEQLDIVIVRQMQRFAILHC